MHGNGLIESEREKGSFEQFLVALAGQILPRSFFADDTILYASISYRLGCDDARRKRSVLGV